MIPGKQQSNQEQPFFKVFPNPTTGTFMVGLSGKGSSESIHVEIYRMQGDKLFTRDIPSKGIHEFDLSDRPAGIYFVHLVSGNQTVTVKVIRQ